MKSLLRLVLGTSLATLGLGSLHAAYTLSGYYPGAQQQWSVSIPSAATITGSISVTAPSGDMGMGSIILQDTSNGSVVYRLSAVGTGTQTNSNSQSGISPGNYVLQETFYDLSSPSRWMQGNISADVTW